MQQIVSFSISIKNGFTDIQSKITSLILSYNYETPFSQEETMKRVGDWVKDILFIPSDNNAGEIRSLSDVTMYSFDYDTIFPALFENIAYACPNSEFYGHSEYYSDDYGILAHHDIKYVDQQITNGSQPKAQPNQKYQNSKTDPVPSSNLNLEFSYDAIDKISSNYYDGIEIDTISDPKDGKKDVVIGNLKVTVNINVDGELNKIISAYKNSFDGSSLAFPLYDPIAEIDALGRGLEMIGWDEFKEVFEDRNKELSISQIVHRAKIFFKIIESLEDKQILQTIINYAPKKKDGTLYAKRVTQIAALLCMNSDAQIYLLRARNEAGNAITIEIVQSLCTSMDKLNSDIISKTNLFKN